jgi:hypothetical protein
VSIALASVLIATLATHTLAASVIEARTASTHPMRYLVSRPAHWNTGHTWPVLVIIADARREYREAIQEFMTARGARPYVLVCPVTLTSGGDAHRIREAFQYPDSAWARASRDGDCAFDRAGLDAVLADVRARDHGDARVFMAGLEAGGHVEWAELLGHPERLRAVAFSVPNYIGRCMDESAVKPLASGAARLPVRVYRGERDSLWLGARPFRTQYLRGRALAEKLGICEFSEVLVRGQGRGFYADSVLAWFNRVRGSSSRIIH